MCLPFLAVQRRDSTNGKNYFSCHRENNETFNWLWNSSCQHKHKVFCWLILQDRLSTKELLKRKNLELASYICVLCSKNIEESALHLFAHCKFAKDCWGLLSTNKSGGGYLSGARKLTAATFTSLLYGNHHTYVLKHLDNKKQIHLRWSPPLFSYLQGDLHKGVLPSLP